MDPIAPSPRRRSFRSFVSSYRKHTSDHWRYIKTKNVCCNAAVSYEATIAWIDGAVEGTEGKEAKAACNLAGMGRFMPQFYLGVSYA